MESGKISKEKTGIDEEFVWIEMPNKVQFRVLKSDIEGRSKLSYDEILIIATDIAVPT